MRDDEILKLALDTCEEFSIAAGKTVTFDIESLLSFARKVIQESKNQWMPIETAPKDGSRYIAAYEYEGIWFCEVVGNHAVLTSSSKAFPATHWMPLPPAPTR